MGNGGFMLNFMIDFVKKFNQIFKVNEILLDDLSYKLCYNLNNNELHIPLSLIYTLINGIPWYSKYGLLTVIIFLLFSIYL